MTTQDSQNLPAQRASFDTETLRNITSMQDAFRLAEQEWGGVVDATEAIGDGFAMVEDKRTLVNVPMVMLQWMFTPGDFGEEYVIVRLITERGDKCIITDGGTGIRRQLREFTDRTGKPGGLMVARGLRVSEYDTDEHGQPTTDPALATGRGQTFYLNV